MTIESAAERGPRRVLMVLYLFPPLGGVGMSRNVRNARNLQGYGWTPVVLTPANPAYLIRDESTLGLVDSGMTVVRTASIEAGHIRSGIRRLATLVDPRRVLRRAGNGGASTGPTRGTGDATRSDAGASATSDTGDDAGSIGGLLRRAWRRAFFPDEQVGWLPFAVRGALRIQRDRPVDVIFSTSSPVTAHVVAGFVHRATGVPWVAEFRDPWVGNVLDARQPWMVRTLRRRLERWIARNAAEIVCVTPTLTRMYEARYPETRVTLVSNGYDRTERVPRSSNADADADGCYRIVFTGTLDRPRELEIFLEGIDRLVNRRPDVADRLRVTFYGLVSDGCREIVRRMTVERPIARVVTLAGFVPRSQATQAVADADAALVLLGAGPGMDLFIGGKVYDYLGQDQQVFAMVPPGDAREVLSSLDWGVIAEPEPASVEQALERLIETPRPDRPADPDRRYDRAILAGQLAACLDRARRARTPTNLEDHER